MKRGWSWTDLLPWGHQKALAEAQRPKPRLVDQTGPERGRLIIKGYVANQKTDADRQHVILELRVGGFTLPFRTTGDVAARLPTGSNVKLIIEKD